MNRKGFTLIELMVVIFIVGILAAVAIPIMRGRIDAAKWSEGKAAAGSIRTAIRAAIAEKGNDYPFSANLTTLEQLGFATGDLDGKYFGTLDYTFTITDGSGATQPTYLITVTAGVSGKTEAPTSPTGVTLDDTGLFTDL